MPQGRAIGRRHFFLAVGQLDGLVQQRGRVPQRIENPGADGQPPDGFRHRGVGGIGPLLLFQPAIGKGVGLDKAVNAFHRLDEALVIPAGAEQRGQF